MTEPYYSDGQVTIYHGRAEEVMPSLDVDLIVTSPPYNVGIDYGDGINDGIPTWDYDALIHQWAGAMGQALGSSGRAFINVAPVVADVNRQRIPLAHTWTTELIDAMFDIRETIAWCSMRGSGTAWGSYQSPSAPNIRGDHENILVAHRGSWALDAPDDMQSWRDGEGGWPDLVSNVWHVQPEHTGRSDHPVPFPLEIPARCIRLGSWPGQTVLDPFMGSGTTLRAAVNLGRKAVGIEMSERFCEMAVKRLGQQSLALGGAA